VHVCEACGVVAVANLKKNQFYCTACKATTGIVQVGGVGPRAAAAPLLPLLVATAMLCYSPLFSWFPGVRYLQVCVPQAACELQFRPEP
jgi:hypothetical protein